MTSDISIFLVSRLFMVVHASGVLQAVTEVEQSAQHRFVSFEEQEDLVIHCSCMVTLLK